MTDEHSPVQTTDQAHTAEAAGHDEHGPADREWTHDPLERSFFGTVGRGYVIGIIVFGLFAFAMIRTQAKDWGVGAAIGGAAFVAFFAGVLGGVVLIGLWAMKNEELIRGNEAGEPGAGGWVGDPSDDDETRDGRDRHDRGRDRCRNRARGRDRADDRDRGGGRGRAGGHGRRRRYRAAGCRRGRHHRDERGARRRAARDHRRSCSRGHRHHLTTG